MNWGFMRFVGRVSMYQSGQKGHCFAKVGIEGEEIDGERNRCRGILRMRLGLTETHRR